MVVLAKKAVETSADQPVHPKQLLRLRNKVLPSLVEAGDAVPRILLGRPRLRSLEQRVEPWPLASHLLAPFEQHATGQGALR